MSVRQVTRRDRGREQTFWIVDVVYRHPDGRAERVKRTPRVQTRRGAEQLERELLAALAAGAFGRKEEGPEPAPLFSEFAASFLSTYVANNNKHSEAETKASIFKRHLVPFFGEKRLDAVGVEDVERYKARKLKGSPDEGIKPLSPKTINNHLTALHKLYAVAVEWKKVPPHAPPRVQWLAVPPPRFDFLDFHEADALVASARPEWRCMLLVALRTGLRLGELRGLRWCDVDFRAEKVVVRQAIVRGRVVTPKSGKSRDVPLSPDALEALKAHRHLRGEYVFAHEKGRALTKNECKSPLRSALRRAGLRAVGWHALRHTFASHLVMRGAPLKTVQELLGHATLEMTLRYAHLSPDSKRDAVRLLGPSHGHGADTASAGRKS